MLGIDFSCGTYQITYEHIMVTVTSLLDRKSVGRNDSHIFCARPCYFSLPGWRHWFTWQPRAPAKKATNAEMPNSMYPLLFQYLSHSVLNNVRGRYEKCIVLGNKDFWIGKWVERHNGDHVIHVTSVTSWVIEKWHNHHACARQKVSHWQHCNVRQDD